MPYIIRGPILYDIAYPVWTQITLAWRRADGPPKKDTDSR